jgi:hypothetical protein
LIIKKIIAITHNLSNKNDKFKIKGISRGNRKFGLIVLKKISHLKRIDSKIVIIIRVTISKRNIRNTSIFLKSSKIWQNWWNSVRFPIKIKWQICQVSKWQFTYLQEAIIIIQRVVHQVFILKVNKTLT